MQKILVLDNYDSFTYNLVHMIRELGYGAELTIVRNDQISLEDVAVFDKILLSPGPGIPSEAGIMKDLIDLYAPSKSILGICLGHQGIAEAFGAQLYNLKEVVHGLAKPTILTQQPDDIFNGLPVQFQTGRYHSWAVSPENFPEDLIITAIDDNQEVMAIKHKELDIRGLQFHPESILTEHGEQLIKNWILSTKTTNT